MLLSIRRRLRFSRHYAWFWRDAGFTFGQRFVAFVPRPDGVPAGRHRLAIAC